MGKLGREEFYRIAGVKQHAEFEKYLRDLLFKPKERSKFYKELLAIDNNVFTDTFRQYFEEYAAERKANQQDYTPDAVSHLVAALSRTDASPKTGWSGYDPTAGTGSLIIQKWSDDMLAETPFSYAPHNYLYMVEEMGDNVIPYLLHNLAIRGMNCIVVHGNTLERNVKQIYFVQNSSDDYLKFSDINVMPHSNQVKEEFDVTSWDEEAIDHIESGKVAFVPALPMHRKGTKTNYDAPIVPYDIEAEHDKLRLKDVAHVERAKAKKVYPAGTIVIQMSATRGQIGLLKSSGEVETKYAVISSTVGDFLFYALQVSAPHHFHRVQQGLNLTLQDIETIPVALTLATKPIEYRQTSLDLGMEP